MMRRFDHHVQCLRKELAVECLWQCNLILLQLLEPALYTTERFCTDTDIELPLMAIN